MSKRAPSTTVCFDCEAVYETTLPKCPNCGLENNRPTGNAVSIKYCEFELDGDRCPLYASIDKRWCRFHHGASDREHTDGNRGMFEQLLMNAAQFATAGFSVASRKLIGDRIDPNWYRQDGESKDDYHDRMMALTRPLYARIGSGLGMPSEQPLDRKAIQEAAQEERRRQAFQHVQMPDLIDAFDDEMDRLMDEDMEPEAAAGIAFQRVLKEAMS